MLRRWFKDPFYICEYSSDRESGKFACLGTTFEEASSDALKHVEKIAHTNGEFSVRVRAANLFERLR